MFDSRNSTWPWLCLIPCLFALPGCKGSISVLGNVASMVVAIVLLWSTLNINRT